MDCRITDVDVYGEKDAISGQPTSNVGLVIMFCQISEFFIAKNQQLNIV